MTNERDESRQLVWDLPTRVFHWALAASFAGAYLLSESERLRNIHVMFGYTVLGLVVFRLLWGFVGTRYARFSSFAYGPGKALAYLRDLLRGRARDHTGHNPAGSWAIYLLLLLAAATGATGWMNLNAIGGEAMEEAHEVLANAWLALVFVHVAGVIVGSLVHRRNLVRSMITGWRHGGAGATGGPRTAVGLTVAAAAVAFWAVSLAGFGPAGAAPVSAEHPSHRVAAGGHWLEGREDPEREADDD